MLVYIITRFSILDFNFKGYRLTRKNSKNIQDYKNKLFAKNRLDYKFDSFEKITLPSIVNQTNQNYVWEIYTSKFLPEEYKERLIKLTKPYDKIKIYFIESFKDFNNSEKTTDNYCTARLDDDDGLNKDFIEKLQKFENHKNTIVSFPCGQKVTIQNNEIIYGVKMEYKKIAIGLCAINMNIYNCGEHTLVDRKYKVIYDSTPDMYSLILY
jgi:hypothetical protein